MGVFQQMLLATGVGGLDVQTVTVGGGGTALAFNRQRGFISAGFGSIVNGTSNLYSGAAITELYFDENLGSPNDFVSRACGVNISYS